MAARDAQTSSGENNRVKYAVAWLKGSQVPMQDAHTAMLDLDGSNSRSFFGVFDGHGGDTVALYCSEQFHAELIQDPDYKTNLQTAMLRMYFRADEKLKASDKWRKPPSSKGKLQRCMDSDLCGVCQLWKKPYTGPQEEGSTACVAIIEGNRILVANAGDSRCVLSRNGEAIDLSTDHKPNVEDEKKRIQAAGGQVLKNEMSKIKLGEFAELGIPRVDGKLLISRSIGDLAYKQDETLIPEQQKVTCNPDIFSVDITDDIDFLLIATNGIWDVKSSQQVVDLVHAYLGSGETDLTAICEGLVSSCMESGDNSTVILVQFKAENVISSSLTCPPTQAKTIGTASTSGDVAKPDTRPEIEMVQSKFSITPDDKEEPAPMGEHSSKDEKMELPHEIHLDHSNKTSEDGNKQSAPEIAVDQPGKAIEHKNQGQGSKTPGVQSISCWPFQDKKLKGRGRR